MTYPQTTRYLESFINYEKIPQYPYKESLKLERIKDFLDTIGDPQDPLRCIHIAGTKGKGSTCAFIAYILREAGFKVGLYTSPHLSDFRERIRLLEPITDYRLPITDYEGMISKRELTALLEKLKPAIEEYNKNSKYGPLSFFEVYTTLAFIYFREKKVDFVVLETGLGGRLDATNVVNPLVCAITPISYEHTQKLGNTLREIATEKAGIIKNSCQLSAVSCQPIVISAPQEKEVLEVIRNRCKEVKAKLYEVGKDILVTDYRLPITDYRFRVKGIVGEYPDLKIRLIGEHQRINATVATAVIKALRAYNIKVSVNSIKKGLYNTRWPGRCEVISRNPLVVLDGAQNIASAKALKETIKENFSAENRSLPVRQAGAKGRKYKKLILVLGISCDKDIKGICDEFGDLADEFILTKANNPRATEPESLAKYFNGRDVHITNSVREAKEFSRRIANKEDLILVTGSLFVVGEYRDSSPHDRDSPRTLYRR